MKLTFKDMDPSRWDRALRLARQFQDEYPDKEGVRDGVAYVREDAQEDVMYVYRTKTSIIVSGQQDDEEEK